MGSKSKHGHWFDGARRYPKANPPARCGAGPSEKAVERAKRREKSLLGKIVGGVLA